MTIRFGAMLATIEEEEKNASVATGLRRSNGRKQEERAEGDAPSGAGPHIGANECQSEAARGDGREQASCGGDKKTSVLFDVASLTRHSVKIGPATPKGAPPGQKRC